MYFCDCILLIYVCVQDVSLSTNATEQNTTVITNAIESQEDKTITTTQMPSVRNYMIIFYFLFKIIIMLSVLL